MTKRRRNPRETNGTPPQMEPDELLRSLKDGNVLIAAAGYYNLQANLQIPDDLFEREKVAQYRMIISELRQKAVSLNALATTDRIHLDKFASVLAKGAGLVTNNEPGGEARQALAEALFHTEQINRLYELLADVENFVLRGKIAEVVGELVVSTARLSKFDRVSASAANRGRSLSAAARAALSNAKTDRRNRIRDAAFEQFKAHPDRSNARIAAILAKQLPDAFRTPKGQLSSETVADDVKALREEWRVQEF